MPITKGFRQLIDEANAQITTYTVAQVLARLRDPTVQLVDIRDMRELEREGTIDGAVLAPRGMLEFWVDPASPYFKPVFGDEGKEFVITLVVCGCTVVCVSKQPARSQQAAFLSSVCVICSVFIGLMSEIITPSRCP